MKKKLWLLAVTALIVGFIAMSLSLTGCDNGTTPSSHNHNWGEWTVTKAATCSAAGAKERVCKDDATHKETDVIPIDTDAHDYHFVEGSGTAPTCTEDGEGNEVCSYNSSHIKNGVVIDKLGHEFETYDSNHDADCEHDGTETAKCVRFDVCDKTDTITEVGSALGHDYHWTQTTAPTCTAVGVEAGTCTHDGTHTTTRPIAIDPDAHNWEWVVTTPATYTADVETGTCTHDHNHTTTRPIPPTPFTNIADFKTWLDSQPVNTAAVTYSVKVNVNNLSGAYNTAGTLGNALNTNLAKYVSLDLSGSTFTDNRIGNIAFQNCNNLTSVNIPDSVTTIAQSAFYNNQLTSVTIGKGVTFIGDQAFEKSSLANVTIPNSVTSIGYSAFADNPITSIRIGANVKLGSKDSNGILGQGTGFNGAYSNNNSRAGTYTRPNAKSTTWTRR
jgi:hypothetical protein